MGLDLGSERKIAHVGASGILKIKLWGKLEFSENKS